MVYFQRLTVASVLFYVVESTLQPCPVTAEAAGSSPVVPAIHSKRVAPIPFFPAFHPLLCDSGHAARFYSIGDPVLAVNDYILSNDPVSSTRRHGFSAAPMLFAVVPRGEGA
jgi:hypothetical protein